MKRYLFLFLLVSALYDTASAQSEVYYWIKFKDKYNNPYTLNAPQQFLSQRSIERRAKQGIALDNTDLPITEEYIDSIRPFITRVVHRLKWFNMVVVQLDTLVDFSVFKQYSCVDSVANISKFPYKSLQQQNKFEALNEVDQHIVYPNSFGASYHQLNMMNADLVQQLGYRGQGIIMGIMDNGIVNGPTIHAFDSARPHIIDTWDFVHDRQNIYLDGGHGTSTFGCVAGNLPNKFIGSAPDATFCLYQTEDNNSEWVMEEYNWAAAAERADSMGAQVFSTSLGYTAFTPDAATSHHYYDLTGNRTMITQAGNVAFSKGILVLNSAGNEGNNAWHYIAAPADGNDILAIGAVDSTRKIANFSSRGPNYLGRVKPDICAQGANAAVIATDGSVSTSNGTSFSCPILAGCAASLWSAFPDSSAKTISTAVVVTADRFWTPDSTYGYGIPNFYNAYLALKTGYNSNILNTTGEIKVYPVPFTDQLNVSLYDAEYKEHTVQLFDMLGQKLAEKKIAIRDKTFEIVTFNTGTLPAGTYLVGMDGDWKKTQKIVKVK